MQYAAVYARQYGVRNTYDTAANIEAGNQAHEIVAGRFPLALAPRSTRTPARLQSNDFRTPPPPPPPPPPPAPPLHPPASRPIGNGWHTSLGSGPEVAADRCPKPVAINVTGE